MWWPGKLSTGGDSVDFSRISAELNEDISVSFEGYVGSIQRVPVDIEPLLLLLPYLNDT